MMLFKFDFNDALLNFRTIASMKFNFDLNLILIWSRDYVLFKWNVKNSYHKIWKNSVSRVSTDWEFSSINWWFLSINGTGIDYWSSHPKTLWWISSIFQSIKNSFQSIEQESRIDRVVQNLRGEFLQYFDWSRIPFNRSNDPFDRLIMDQESIRSSRDFKMY